MTIYHNITEDYPVFNTITALWLFVLISQRCSLEFTELIILPSLYNL